MIIDDEEPVREALVAITAAAGHETCSVSDGSRALAQLSTFKPDLVVTDILMPGMEGMQTIREFRKLRPDLPIIAVSGWAPYGGLSYLKTAERMGADRSIPKPVSPRALIEAVTQLLRHTETRALLRS